MQKINMQKIIKKTITSVLAVKFISLCFVATCFTFSVNAEENTKSTDMPIDLTADKGTFDQKKGIAIYNGNVKVTQGFSTIWADRMVITLKNNVAYLIEATGKKDVPVKFHYKGDKQPINGQGHKMVYKVPQKTVILTGNAVVEQGEDVVKGEVINYDLDKEVIGGKRVQMTFLPKE